MAYPFCRRSLTVPDKARQKDCCLKSWRALANDCRDSTELKEALYIQEDNMQVMQSNLHLCIQSFVDDLALLELSIYFIHLPSQCCSLLF